MDFFSLISHLWQSPRVHFGSIGKDSDSNGERPQLLSLIYFTNVKSGAKEKYRDCLPDNVILRTIQKTCMFCMRMLT